MNIEHVGIYAQDSAALADWYVTTLDLQEVRRIERGEGKSPVIFLQGSSGAVIEILPTHVEKQQRELNVPGFTHLGIGVESMGAQVARLAKLGVEVSGIRSTSNGWTIGYFNDPEGNILEFIER